MKSAITTLVCGLGLGLFVASSARAELLHVEMKTLGMD
jgi:hypothetical protein